VKLQLVSSSIHYTPNAEYRGLLPALMEKRGGVVSYRNLLHSCLSGGLGVGCDVPEKRQTQDFWHSCDSTLTTTK